MLINQPELSHRYNGGIDYAVIITSDVRGCFARSEIQVTPVIMREHRCRSNHKPRHYLLCYYLVTRI
jgi:hypothetical protein